MRIARPDGKFIWAEAQAYVRKHPDCFPSTPEEEAKLERMWERVLEARARAVEIHRIVEVGE